MATNYTPPQFEGGFRGSAQSLGFNPETAVDTSTQEEKKLKQIIEDDAVRERSLERQQRLDTGMLEGRQAIERAQFNYNKAGAEGRLSLLKGLAGFSSTLANTLVSEAEKAEQRAEEAALEAEQMKLVSGMGFGLSPDLQKGIAEQQRIDMQITADAQGIGEVSQQLSAEGDDGTAQQLTNSSLYAQDAPQRRSLAQAKVSHGAWLMDQVSKIDTTNMTNAQIQAEVTKLNKIFASSVMRTKGDFRSIYKLAETMNGNSVNAYQTLYSNRRKGMETARDVAQKDQVALSAQAETPAQAFAETMAQVQNDPLFRGDRGTAKREAFGLLTAQYVSLGRPDLVRQLIQVDPGTGTPFGKDARFAAQIREAINKAEAAAQKDWDTQTRAEAREIQQIMSVLHKDMSPAARKIAVEKLDAIGSNEAREQARNILSKGMLYDDDFAYKVEKAFRDGDPYTTFGEEEIRVYINRGRLTEDSLKFAKEASPEMKEAAKVVKDIESTLEGRLEGNVFETIVKDGKSTVVAAAPLDSDAYKRYGPEIALRAALLKKDLTRELAKRAKTYSPEDLPNQALDILKGLLEKPYYKLSVVKGRPVGYKAAMPGDPSKYRIVREGEKGTPTKQLAHLEVDDIAILQKDGQVSSQHDRLYNGEDEIFKADIIALAEGRRPSKRTQELADTLNISTRELIDDQMRLNGMGTLEAREGNFFRDEQLEKLRNVQPTDARSAAAAFQDYGVPPKAAGQLARLSQVNYTADDGRPGLPGMSQTQRDALNRIANKEAGPWGYDAANEGSYDTAGTQPINSGSGTEKYGRALTDMTVGEILDLGAKGDIHAAGRYQFIHSTLKEQVEKHGVPLDAKYDERVQDYITLAYMRQNPTAWVGINQKDPGALGKIKEAAQEPLPPAPWLGGTDPRVMMRDMRKNNPRQFNIIMNKASSPNMVRGAIIDVYGPQAGLVSTAPKKVYTTGNLGWGSTGDHVDIKPVSPGDVYANRNLPMTRTELDQYVAVATSSGLKPLSQAMIMTASDADHRNRARSSHGIDFAHEKPNRELYLTNGARVIENYMPSGGEGSHRLLIEVPGGKRYAFLHGTSTIPLSN